MSADRGGAELPALIAALSGPGRDLDRVEELELLLRRIGAEVRSAVMEDTMEPAIDMNEIAELGGLTTRQWEVLHRLLSGKRVAVIASELYISRSTVRNHLSTIYQRFGVHTQTELVVLLLRARA